MHRFLSLSGLHQHLLVRLHQLIRQNLLLKVRNMRRVTPRLQPHLLLERISETPKPPFPRELRIHVLERTPVQQLPEPRDARVIANVVVNGGQLDDLAQEGDGTLRPEILVADDGLADRLRLVFGAAELAEEVEGYYASVEVEGHVRCGEVLGRGADVVEQSGKREG